MREEGKNTGKSTETTGFFAFEKLDVYHLSVSLAAQVYAMTKNFPAEERFGLTNQLRRAATSVTLNIAEGSGRGSQKDFARFLFQARGSVFELVAALHLAQQLGYVDSEAVLPLNTQAHTLPAKLMAFINKISPA